MESAPEERFPLLLAWIGVLALWGWVSLPLILGQDTLFYRDVFTTHLHLKFFGAEQLAQARIPAVNPGWGLGQPFRGNPNALPFYPGNLLYLVLPFWSAFNLHYVAHWLLSLCTMRALARALGQSQSASLLAALAYAGSGWLLSTLSYYNLLTVSAWWPVAMWGAVRGGRRGIALGGLACGMALLGGEPFLAALGLGPLVAVAVGRWGWRRGGLTALGIGVVGLAASLPQAVATFRVLSFTSRGAVGVGAGEASIYALPLVRLMELLAPLPLGRPGELGELSHGAVGWLEGPPYVLSIFFGLVPLWLALLAGRRRWALAGWAVGGFFLAWLGGLAGPLWQEATGGLARYPAKLLFWPALMVPVLAGFSLDSCMGRKHGRVVGLGVVLLLAGAAVPILFPWVPHLLPQGSTLLESRVAFLLVGMPLLMGGALLGVSAWALERRRRAWIPVLHLVGFLQMAPLLLVAPVHGFREPPPLSRYLPEGAGVVSSLSRSVLQDGAPSLDLPSRKAVELVQAINAQLDFPTGLLHGYRYPLAPDLDGIHSPYLLLLQRNLLMLSWEEKIQWLRVLGVDGVVLPRDPGQQGLRLVAADRVFGVTTTLLQVERPLPRVTWPRRIVVAENPLVALRQVGAMEDPELSTVVPKALTHDPRGTVRLLEETPDRIVMETSGQGGLAVVQTSFHPIYRVREPAGASIVPADLCLLGVVVPPGTHRVVVDISHWPEVVAGIAALMAILLSLAAGRKP